LWLHQYIGSRTTVDLGVPVDIELHSALPWNGEVTLRLGSTSPAESTLHLRLPSWCSHSGVQLEINREPFTQRPSIPDYPPTGSGYDPRLSQFISIRRSWTPGDTLRLQLDLPILLRRAHPKIKGHRGKAALTRGPLVYCLESIDNPGIDIFTARLDPASLRPEKAPDLLGGAWILRGQTTDGQAITAIPYHLWANRGPSQMTVWVNI
jgi:hypothetical protein